MESWLPCALRVEPPATESYGLRVTSAACRSRFLRLIMSTKIVYEFTWPGTDQSSRYRAAGAANTRGKVGPFSAFAPISAQHRSAALNVAVLLVSPSRAARRSSCSYDVDLVT
jgi:hypothetical protein